MTAAREVAAAVCGVPPRVATRRRGHGLLVPAAFAITAAVSAENPLVLRLSATSELPPFFGGGVDSDRFGPVCVRGWRR